MGEIYFTSDLHLGHNKSFLFEKRGFLSITEHDEILIENWNKVVKFEDHVFLLGDAYLGDDDRAILNLNALHGHILLLPGNHESRKKLNLIARYCANIDPLTPYENPVYLYENSKDWTFLCSHYPINTSSLKKTKKLNQCLICLHGHAHSTERFTYNVPYMYNVCVDAHNFAPVALDEIKQDIKNKRDEMLAQGLLDI